jgi:hypothetical protein
MSELSQRVKVEFANLQRIFGAFPAIEALPTLSALEIAGTAALLHNFYNGVENILKQVVRARGREVPAGDSWHRDLVNLACAQGIVSETTATELRQYLAFRHFFSHGYAAELDLERMQPLLEELPDVYGQFRRNIESALEDDHGRQ